ncbi:predicted protein [Pyrenophora tritici-repentis Pt-1C-BFP]|uniref:Uncharacterized protein n=1 Tax=Pyrenophora tritici-repentis (strain Pt-1C-BFP) TaxID=426418 RepID=B2WIT0_PYRTR|nr:uncharacterized protein PTRG_09889 [Pyrenophora tritici-repentis Pt-1C-BFP]EDU42940.1 predicted protein [Pyrenophora tritici-repentis Pt-1C-BFP]
MAGLAQPGYFETGSKHYYRLAGAWVVTGSEPLISHQVPEAIVAKGMPFYHDIRIDAAVSSTLTGEVVHPGNLQR